MEAYQTTERLSAALQTRRHLDMLFATAKRVGSEPPRLNTTGTDQLLARKLIDEFRI
jgi:hypothetical protein